MNIKTAEESDLWDAITVKRVEGSNNLSVTVDLELSLEIVPENFDNVDMYASPIIKNIREEHFPIIQLKVTKFLKD